MKIKEVVTVTGLTDRTIRYYIEEGLISPDYTENYFGRKSFSFSENETELLLDIASLRTYGFTVSEIRDLLNSPESSEKTLEAVKARTAREVKRGAELLAKIDSLCDGKSHTLAEIAEALRTHEQAPLKEEKFGAKELLRLSLAGAGHVLVFAVAVLPMALSIVLCFISLLGTGYRYPTFNKAACAVLLICFLLYTSVFVLPKFKKSAAKITRCVLVILCILAIPFNILASLGIISCSEAYKTENYLKLDSEVVNIIKPQYRELFPAREEIISEDAKSISYHYRFKGGDVIYAFDIFLEREFESDAEYFAEVERLKALFDKSEKETGKSGSIFKYGSFSVHFLPWSLTVPFEARWQDFYTYVIFAFDDSGKTVRYIYNTCTEFSGFESAPYYLKLNWNS